jgi:hypothetical protein
VDAEPITTWATGESSLQDLHFDPSGNLLTGTSAGRIVMLSIPQRRLVWIVPRSVAEHAHAILLIDSAGRAEGDPAVIQDLGLRRAGDLLQSLTAP